MLPYAKSVPRPLVSFKFSSRGVELLNFQDTSPPPFMDQSKRSFCVRGFQGLVIRQSQGHFWTGSQEVKLYASSDKKKIKCLLCWTNFEDYNFSSVLDIWIR